MHDRSLHIVALMFISLVVLQSLLGGAVFATTVGWTPESIGDYYAVKTLHGLLETIAPHTLFIAIALMGSLHFLGFISTIDEKQKQYWINLLFVLFAIDQSAPVFINLGIDFFAYVKLSAFIGFEIALAGVSYVLFRHTLMVSKV